MGCNTELNAEKRGVLTSEEALVTLLTDSYLSNGQIVECTCIAAICMRKQIVYFITWQMMKLYPHLRVFMVDFDEQTLAEITRFRQTLWSCDG